MNEVKRKRLLRKLIKEGKEKLLNDVYYHPKKREEFRKVFIEAQESFAKNLEIPERLDSNYQFAQDRAWQEVFLDQMTKWIDAIDNVIPKKLKEIELKNGKFKLFKKRNGKGIVFKCSFDKGVPKKHHTVYMLIPCGYPAKGKRTKIDYVRDKKYDLKGFELKDSGTFTQKEKSFTKAVQVFKGKKIKIKFEVNPRGKSRDMNWLKVIK